MSDEQDENDGRRTKLVKAGVAVGIGSAAIVAALLYASKVKKPKRGAPKPPSTD
ncbi:MAG: isopropylmalate isomerase [Pseudomonadota bacterium]|nr:isopropylmalate isomerase [Pseudomonadota bacterium]